MALERYREKRNFGETPEPSSGKEKSSAKLTFVVQRHDASHLHYDFRLEMDGVLKSWAVPKGPSMKAGERRLAVHVEDHPLAYGKFYGEIPEGNYGAGIVDIWDNGTYVPLEPEKGKSDEKLFLHQYYKGDLKFILKGKHLKGAFALVRMNDGTDKNWLLIKKSDEYAVKSYNIASIDPIKPYHKKKPAASKNQKSEAPKKKETKDNLGLETEAEPDLPKTAINQAWIKLKKPMLATLAESHNDHPDWLYEPKYDGYRAITKISGGKVEIVSRNGNSFNKQYESLIPELEKFEDDLILDGEIVIEDKKGISNFQLLQNYIKTRNGILRYYVFDILYLNGYPVTQLPLIQRKELLDAVFAKVKLTNVQPSPLVAEHGKELMGRLTKLGYEGVIAKESNSPYFPGLRSDSWLKLKTRQSLEAIICGYTAPQNSRKFFGSLILGIHDKGKLVYIGNCGTGFTETSLRELHEQFEKLKTAKSPFDVTLKMTRQKGKPTWMKPELVCNVEFANWTDDKHLRVPVFMGLRIDKKAVEVMKNNDTKPDSKPRMEKTKTEETGRAAKKASSKIQKYEENDTELKINGKVLKITNRNKVYFPESDITKGEIIDYYRKISKFILPYLKNRPESLNRHPNGITKSGFYQKDMDTTQIPEWVRTEKQYSKSNAEYLDYLICDNEATLVYMANLGCIEINPWHSTYDKPDYPDYMIMDLDPGEIGFKEVVRTALKIRDVCTEIGITTFCKTSGATGLHVYIPLKKRYTYDEIKLFGELLATAVQQQLPDTTSIERTVSKRTDKIYIDFLQNRKGQTIAAAYSVRPKPGATVSTPLEWTEVNERLDPKAFTIYTIFDRLEEKGDLWKGVLGKGADIGKALERLEGMI
ncbi:MAG: ligD [Fluviicola sp.]|jgi:bifunctional non-homologous end joining protein LigD|uniref:DNA ligase D n=1 Tax=Fluviicola sp. TaxID=1917219 RepID=UPI002616B9A8|nr:DNA ligase D [Fluviicola sp.]MDF3027248.1 ligD [Fluviicola sp.]